MNKELHAGYETILREFRYEFSHGGAYTSIALVLLGVGLDYALYPQMQWPFAIARVWVAIMTYGIILVMQTKWGKAWIQWLTFVWLFIPQIMIAWMIGVTEGATSIYWAGLTLAIYASGIVLAFGLWQNIIFGVLSFLLYVVACSHHPESFELRGAFAINSIFLLMSAVISAVFTYFNERARFLLFRLKAEVAEKNTQLEETNKSLSEIKGHMLQQEKMAALGTLSAGLLHEVNNPVNYCLMALDVAKEKPVTKADAGLGECLQDASEGMRRVQQIVSDLKKFAYRSSNGAAESSSFLFDKALDTAIRMVGFETKGMNITRNLPSGTLVRGDETAIIGVLINLLDNAALAIRTKDYAKTGDVPTIHVFAEWLNGKLHVVVQDNGPGIAPENLARVFEPFFTTREIGRGLGLGLSISYGVIERNGGRLVAESQFGEWTKMIFDLPGAE